MKILQVDHKVTHYTCHVIGFEAHLPSSECGDVFLTRQKLLERSVSHLQFKCRPQWTNHSTWRSVQWWRHQLKITLR